MCVNVYVTDIHNSNASLNQPQLMLILSGIIAVSIQVGTCKNNELFFFQKKSHLTTHFLLVPYLTVILVPHCLIWSLFSCTYINQNQLIVILSFVVDQGDPTPDRTGSKATERRMAVGIDAEPKKWELPMRPHCIKT